jgi:hypothetical protein
MLGRHPGLPVAVGVVPIAVCRLAASDRLSVVLGAAAAAGFAAVVAFAMNLRKEPRAVKVVFVVPLALPILFVVALVADALTRGPRP